MTTSPIIIDISHYQSVSSFEKVKAAGIVGVICKATEGSTYVDDKYDDHRAQAEAAGLIVASYHFLKHGNVAAQISHYLAVANPGPGERVVIDYEDTACTLDDLRQAVQALLDDKQMNYQVTVYGGSHLESQLGNSRDALLAENTSLWTAQYTSAAAPSWPTGTWPHWTLWQYTDKAAVPGISGGVDGNRFNGSDENCLKWLSPAGGASIPEPGTDPDEPLGVVKIAIEAPPGIAIEVSVDGQPYRFDRN